MKDYLPLVVAVVAGLVALVGYLLNSAGARRAEKMRRYAEALDAVERYRQLPYSFRRMHDETPETRKELAGMLGKVQVDLAFHRRWLTLDSSELGCAYDALVDKIREKNSECRVQALSETPVNADVGIEIGKPYVFDDKQERADCIRLMRKGLGILRNLS